MAIRFFYEDIAFTISHPVLTRKWLIKSASQEGFAIAELNYVFCSDNYLLDINRQYLEHDYYTDIITFDQSETPTNEIQGDIYISIDRVRENANDLEIPFETELYRVLVHGLLHLIGFGDKTNEESDTMRSKEDHYLSLWNKA